MKRMLILCLVLLLTACGGGAANSGTPVPTVDATGLSVGGFKATVSGSVSGDFAGTGSYFKQEQGGLLISLVGMSGVSGATVTIILPTGTLAGLYTPISYNDAYDSAANKITGIGASFSGLNQSNGVDAYTIISDGSLTLQSVDPMTGSIHFKAKLESGGEVEVTATFYQLTAV
jgi:hypothetical protein